MRLVLSFLMALSAVAVLILGAAPASAMDHAGDGGACHGPVADQPNHDGHDDAPAGLDSHVMHCCVACTPQAALPVAAPLSLAFQQQGPASPPDSLGTTPALEPDPPRL